MRLFGKTPEGPEDLKKFDGMEFKFAGEVDTPEKAEEWKAWAKKNGYHCRTDADVTRNVIYIYFRPVDNFSPVPGTPTQ